MKAFYLVQLKNVPQVLTYQSDENIPVGSLVEVSLGKRSVNGVIVEKTEQPDYDCVPIQKTLIPEALSPLQIELCRWMSSYYFASLQKCLQLFIPNTIWSHRMEAQYEVFIQLESQEKALAETSKAPKQKELVNYLIQNKKVSLSELKKHFSTPIITTLQKKNLLRSETGKLLNPDAQHRSKPYHDQPLTIEQTNVLKKILEEERKPRNLNDSKTSPIQNSGQSTMFLLHGITGSGKTEVYLQMIKKSIAEGKQSLMLVPEIALTTELIQYFSDHFPEQISIIHSRLSDRQRVQAWHRIHQGETKLIMGSRSAFFTPWKNLANIIIDEEHEWTYKQESSPRYHIRKVAEELLKLMVDRQSSTTEVPKLLLGSATPSIETFFKADKLHSASDTERATLEHQLLSMANRATPHPLPPVKVVDLREEYQKKNFSMFSEALQEGIKSRLEKQEQVVLFLNKRGSSSSITCRDCGYTPQCENCDIALTFHSKLKDFHNGGMICHYCGSFHEQPQTCPHCHSSAIRYLGTGTQKAEEQLQQLFPTARILRADKDTTGGKEDFENIYHAMKSCKADILLGTQMIAKGLDLPKVTLTGILLADIGLHLPDFRASERVFQLLTQVAGRSGRHQAGEVIIQTYQPDHPAIRAAQQHDFLNFFKQEIIHRRLLNYPPYSQCIRLSFAHENPKIAADEALRVYGILQDNTRMPKDPDSPSIELAPHYIPKMHRKFIWNIHLRGNNPRDILKNVKFEKGWKVDVDPQ